MKTFIFLFLFCIDCFSAVYFDKVDDNIIVLKSSSLNNLSALTISVWIKPYSDGELNLGYIIDKSNSDVSGWRFRLQDNAGAGGSPNEIGFRVDWTTDLIRYTNPITTFNVWQNIIVTWDGSSTASNVHIYRDGVEATYKTTTDATGTRVDDSGNDFVIGSKANDVGSYEGLISELSEWNEVLSNDEIQLLAKSKIKGMPKQIRPSALKIYLPLTDFSNETSGDGRIYKDLSGNNNTGTGLDGANNTGVTNKAEEVLTYP